LIEGLKKEIAFRLKNQGLRGKGKAGKIISFYLAEKISYIIFVIPNQKDILERD